MRTDEPCPEDVPDRFGPIARFYDLVDWGFWLFHMKPRAAVAAAIPAGARRILDLGTGTGAVLVTLALTHLDAVLTGFDASPGMLAVAERKLARLKAGSPSCGDATLVCGNAARLPFDDGAFDAVTGSLFFHEMPPDVRARAFDEAVRVLAPGGTMVVLDLDRRAEGWRQLAQWLLDVGEEGYAWQLSGDGLKCELEGRGLTEIEVTRNMPFVQLAVARKR